MEFMVCLNGETDQHSYLSEIAELGAGIELGGYGLISAICTIYPPIHLQSG